MSSASKSSKNRSELAAATSGKRRCPPRTMRMVPFRKEVSCSGTHTVRVGTSRSSMVGQFWWISKRPAPGGLT